MHTPQRLAGASPGATPAETTKKQTNKQVSECANRLPRAGSRWCSASTANCRPANSRPCCTCDDASRAPPSSLPSGAGAAPSSSWPVRSNKTRNHRTVTRVSSTPTRSQSATVCTRSMTALVALDSRFLFKRLFFSCFKLQTRTIRLFLGHGAFRSACARSHRLSSAAGSKRDAPWRARHKARGARVPGIRMRSAAGVARIVAETFAKTINKRPAHAA